MSRFHDVVREQDHCKLAHKLKALLRFSSIQRRRELQNRGKNCILGETFANTLQILFLHLTFSQNGGF